MSQTYHKIWIHLVWSTKDHQPFLKKDIREELFQHVKEKARTEGYTIDTINGTSDHIHCLVSIPPRISVSEVVNKLKGESSHWINAEKLTKTHFAWQNGFAAFSVSASQISRVRNYIANQEEHHRKISYTEEVDKFLRLYNAEHSA